MFSGGIEKQHRAVMICLATVPNREKDSDLGCC